MIAVWKHELRSAFHGMTAYLFCACFLVFVGIGAIRNPLERTGLRFCPLFASVRRRKRWIQCGAPNFCVFGCFFAEDSV